MNWYREKVEKNKTTSDREREREPTGKRGKGIKRHAVCVSKIRYLGLAWRTDASLSTLPRRLERCNKSLPRSHFTDRIYALPRCMLKHFGHMSNNFKKYFFNFSSFFSYRCVWVNSASLHSKPQGQIKRNLNSDFCRLYDCSERRSLIMNCNLDSQFFFLIGFCFFYSREDPTDAVPRDPLLAPILCCISCFCM